MDSQQEEEMLMNENELPKRKSRNYLKKSLPDPLKNYWRTVLLASMLLVAGFAFLIIATYIVVIPTALNGPHSYVFFLCGAICVIPGGYHVGYMCCAYKGVAGYKLETLPTLNE